MEELELNACIDTPKNTDFQYDLMFGSEESPTKVFHNRTDVQDQSIKREPKTSYACPCFGISHCINEENAIEGSGLYIKGEDLRAKALLIGAKLESGRSLQGALNLAKSEGLITGYAVCKDVASAKQALAKGQMIYTGDNTNDRTMTRSDFMRNGNGGKYGHCWAIVGYDDEKGCFIGKNSYGPNAYDKGYFYILYEDYSRLYTKYAIIDKENADLVLQEKIKLDNKMKSVTENLGLMNGKDLELNMTRGQMEIVIGRIIMTMAGATVKDTDQEIISKFKNLFAN